jgi:glycosyltransferase involved in cell wall biosynthesis
MNMKSRRYIIICPVRNEEKHLPGTIESVSSQTVLPVRWILVNDGSTDRTGEIAEAAAKKYPWISVFNRADRGFRRNGGGVIDTFYDGFKHIGDEQWDYLIKLDGDLSFAPDYFEKCIEKFEGEPRLGIGGGTICIRTEEGERVESSGDPSFHVRGATKIYRRECWDAIGGLLREAGWDTLDEIKSNMLGWRTYTFRDLRLMHHRETGGADGTWKNWVKNGRANYVVGYHPLFMLAKCGKRIFEKPYVVAAVGLLWGYMKGYLTRTPCIQEPQVIRYLRQQQIRRLFFQSSIWAD